MKNIKMIAFALLILCACCVGVTSAETHIPAGTVSTYLLSTEGETYILDGDVTANINAFRVAANNTVLDGNGYSIIYGVTSAGVGVDTNLKHNFTLKNANITSNVNRTNTNGVYIQKSINTTIQNTSISAPGSDGVYIISSNYSVLDNVTVRYANNGVRFYNTTLNNISNSSLTVTANATDKAGLMFDSNSTGNTINNVTVSSDGIGILMKVGSSNNSVYNSHIQAVSKGIYIASSHNTTLAGNIIISTTQNAVKVNNGLNCNFSADNVLSSPYDSAPHTENHILLIGDSITEGGVSIGNTFGAWGLVTNTSLNQNGSGSWYVSNQGYGGETTVQASNRIDAILNLYNPNYVTLMLGTNDFSAGATSEQIVANITQMAATVEEHGATPIILAITPGEDYESIRLAVNAGLKNLSTAENYIFIDTYDCMDLYPENGNYDGWDSSLYGVGPHPNNAGNAILGECIAKNILSTFQLTGLGVNHTVDSNGVIRNLRSINSTDQRINAIMIPNTGRINVSIISWATSGVCEKQWIESSETSNIQTTHVIGDFPANALIQINRDGVNYAQVTSNETGYIDWTYSGGYSEHTFEAFALIGNDFDTARHNAASTWSSSVALLIAIVIIIFSGLLLAAVRGTLSMSLLTNAVIGLMILTLVVLAGAGILSSFEGLI